MSFSRRQGYAASGFANQLKNAFERAQEAPIPIEVHTLSTAGESHRLARENQHVKERCLVLDFRRHKAAAGGA